MQFVVQPRILERDGRLMGKNFQTRRVGRREEIGNDAIEVEKTDDRPLDVDRCSDVRANPARFGKPNPPGGLQRVRNNDRLPRLHDPSQILDLVHAKLYMEYPIS